MRQRESGVSEAIGYIIIFGLVMTGIGLITLYGYPVLMQQESSANIRNMEQTMIVLQNDMKSLTYKLVPYKETTLRVSGGTLTLFDSDNSVIDQTFIIREEGGPDLAEVLVPGELRFEAQKEHAVVTLENGAVMKREIGSTGSFMLAQPRWYIDTSSTGVKTLVINYMRLVPSSGSQILSQTGVGTVRMRHYQTRYFGPYDYPAGANIQVVYSPNTDPAYDYSQAWRNFLTDDNGLDMTEAPANTYTMTGVNSVVVKMYDIIVVEL